jgi:hypothetical protein
MGNTYGKMKRPEWCSPEYYFDSSKIKGSPPCRRMQRLTMRSTIEPNEIKIEGMIAVSGCKEKADAAGRSAKANRAVWCLPGGVRCSWRRVGQRRTAFVG